MRCPYYPLYIGVCKGRGEERGGGSGHGNHRGAWWQGSSTGVWVTELVIHYGAILPSGSEQHEVLLFGSI